MPRIRVPVDDLKVLSGQIQRAANTLYELETLVSRSLGRLDRPPPAQLRLEEQVSTARRQLHLAAERLEDLARSARTVVAGFDEADRRGAAGFPGPPRASAMLPPAMPPGRPWPFAPTPSVLTVPTSQRPRPAEAPAAPNGSGA